MAKIVIYAKTVEDIEKLLKSGLNDCVLLSPEFFEATFDWNSECMGQIIPDAKIVLVPVMDE